MTSTQDELRWKPSGDQSPSCCWDGASSLLTLLRLIKKQQLTRAIYFMSLSLSSSAMRSKFIRALAALEILFESNKTSTSECEGEKWVQQFGLRLGFLLTNCVTESLRFCYIFYIQAAVFYASQLAKALKIVLCCFVCSHWSVWMQGSRVQVRYPLISRKKLDLCPPGVRPSFTPLSTRAAFYSNNSLKLSQLTFGAIKYNFHTS